MTDEPLEQPKEDTRLEEGVAEVPACRELAPSNFYAPEQPLHENGRTERVSEDKIEDQKESRKRVREDSYFSDVAEEDAGSDFDAEADGDSDDSFIRMSKRKRKAEEAVNRRFKPPQDNAMRQKLRGNPSNPASLPATEADSRAASIEEGRDSRAHSRARAENGRDSFETDGDRSETESVSDEEDPTSIPERLVSSEEEREQKDRLKTSWELVSILDFLSSFQSYLNLGHLNFSAEELESCLVLNNGTSGLLPELHMGVMRGISTRSNLHIGNWVASLAERLKLYWRVGRLSGSPPFKPQRRWEAVDYARLPVENRVSALRILCELRLEKDDLQNVVELAVHPPRKTKAEKKAEAQALASGRRQPVEPPKPTMAQMRREPLAKDSSGLLYWYLDYHTTTGTRLYRETPYSLLKAKSKKEQAQPQWELLASSPEDMTELGERLKRSKKKPDQTLADMILEDIVPELLDRRDADLRKQRAAAKRQAQLSNILPTGRSRRARKEVNYSFDAYDATIRAALRQGSSEPENGRPTRSSRFNEPRMTAEEEAELGLRRGRSARAASPPLNLPPTRRAKRPETPTDPDSATQDNSSIEDPAPGFANGAAEPSVEMNGASTPQPQDPSPEPSSWSQPISQPGLNGHHGWGPTYVEPDKSLRMESSEVEISEPSDEETYQGQEGRLGGNSWAQIGGQY